MNRPYTSALSAQHKYAVPAISYLLQPCHSEISKHNRIAIWLSWPAREHVTSVRGRTKLFCQLPGRTWFCQVLPQPAAGWLRQNPTCLFWNHA